VREDTGIAVGIAGAMPGADINLRALRPASGLGAQGRPGKAMMAILAVWGTKSRIVCGDIPLSACALVFARLLLARGVTGFMPVFRERRPCIPLRAGSTGIRRIPIPCRFVCG